MFNLIGDLDKDCEGTILYNNHNLKRKEIFLSVSYLFQDYALIELEIICYNLTHDDHLLSQMDCKLFISNKKLIKNENRLVYLFISIVNVLV